MFVLQLAEGIISEQYILAKKLKSIRRSSGRANLQKTDVREFKIESPYKLRRNGGTTTVGQLQSSRAWGCPQRPAQLPAESAEPEQDAPLDTLPTLEAGPWR
jgi:hypothetical protein